jgi:hypothetical protein
MFIIKPAGYTGMMARCFALAGTLGNEETSCCLILIDDIEALNIDLLSSDILMIN